MESGETEPRTSVKETLFRQELILSGFAKGFFRLENRIYQTSGRQNGETAGQNIWDSMARRR